MQLPIQDFANKQALVMGLGRFGGGVGAARFLARCRAKVTVTDKATAEQLTDSIAQLKGLDITFHLGGHAEEDFRAADVVVVNPAVPAENPYLQIARAAGAQLTAEMTLFFQYCPATLVGITGSNGKSTTTAMTAAVLEAGAGGKGGRTYGKVWLGGNIGRENLLCRIDEIAADDIAVLELSSFQLEDLVPLAKSPHVAVVTNIAPNHLDRHGTMENYIKAKQVIIAHQTPAELAVLNRDDAEVGAWAKLTKAKISWFGDGLYRELPLKVPGRHNQVNACAAMRVAEWFGVDRAAAEAVLCAFAGLPHRLEFVRQWHGVRFFNDSIATTPESVMVAADAFPEPKVFILGGYDKHLSFDALADHLVRTNVRATVLLGQVRAQLHQAIEQAKTRLASIAPTCILVDTFAQAVTDAAHAAQPGDAVILSPACASYDMFRNFEHRGQTFRELVNALPDL
ncbi:MAG: UDP-N-acetylmuramoyl-L-alanine--D-glutamate ligase [Sedimentisphaerales bacterium]|nr:UDP-N-acetylmuramoyl-L-alanine--D-glutamate ligase [Sedimentisphaerales bacterium]